MDLSIIENLFNSQREYFQEQNTRSFDQRVATLRQLKEVILQYESLW
mgnify:CR=1 FL=1|jgi:hypothetical protein